MSLGVAVGPGMRISEWGERGQEVVVWGVGSGVKGSMGGRSQGQGTVGLVVGR